MTKINRVDVREETSPKEKSLFNVEPCLKVEELLKSYKLESLEKFACNFDRMKDQCCALSAMIGFAITNLKLPQSEIEQMLYHVEFYKLATHTLTENEIQVVMPLSSVDCHFRQALQEHNKKCPVFFVSGYGEMIKPISFYTENKVEDEYIIDFNNWLVYMIERHHEIRTFFDFCAECEHDAVGKCKFWENASQSLQQIRSTSTGAECASETRGYLRGLEIRCKIPKSLDELKRGS